MSIARIVLVDDHKIVRDGLKLVLNQEENLDIIAEGGDGEQAIELVKELQPDLLISDISMPKLNGLEAVEQLKKMSTNTKVVFLSMFDKPEYVTFAAKVGADGYILKDADKDEIVRAINKVLDGEKYFSGDVSGILINQLTETPTINNPVEDLDKYNLTKREKQILDFIIQGQTNKQIADEAGISIRTIETHRLNIMKKMKVNSASELIRMALKPNS